MKIARHLMALIALTLLLGCETEDKPRTVVDTLRVLGVQVEPPEVAFDDEVLDRPALLTRRSELTVSTLIVDPANPDAELDVSIIACTELDGQCLEILQYQLLGDPFADEDGNLTEAAYRDYFTRYAYRGGLTLDGVSGVLTGAQLSTFEGYALYLRDVGALEMEARLAVLACPSDTCPVFEALDAYLADDAAEGGAEILRTIATSAGSAEQGGLTDISFARKNYRISQRTPDLTNGNPILEDINVLGVPVEGGEVREFGGQGSVGVTVAGDSYEWVYTYDGEQLGLEGQTVSFFSSSGTVSPGTIQISYQSLSAEAVLSMDAASTSEEPVYLWTVIKDSRGGQAFDRVAIYP